MRFKQHEVIRWTIILIVLASALTLALFIDRYLGFAGTLIPGEPGAITTVFLDDRRQTAFWHGLFGLVFSDSDFNETQTALLAQGDISSKIFVFTCVDPNAARQEFYATLNSTINFTNITAGSTEMVDDVFLALDPSTTERANKTFTDFVNFSLGSQTIENVPAAYSYVNNSVDINRTFFTGILNASNELVFVIGLLQNSGSSFKGSLVRYQALLPLPNASRTYTFFPDPNDVCPPGFGVGQFGDGYISGYIIDSNTSLPLENVTVSAAGNITLTNGSGFFNLTVLGGRRYNLVAMKTGYLTNYSLVNTSIGITTHVNISMNRFFGYKGPNGTISGYARDNDTNAVLSNVLVNIGDQTVQTNGSGNYSLNITAGSYVVAAVLSGYNNFVENLTLLAFQNLSYIINMTTIESGIDITNGTVLQNGTLQGYVDSNASGQLLENVTVVVNGVSDLSNGSGFYNLSAVEGSTNLVAIKEGFSAFYAAINISPLNITEFNFSMIPVTLTPGNGSIAGLVRDVDGNLLVDALVSAAGVSNLTPNGAYQLLNIPGGSHNLVATLDGYINFFTLVNVTPGQETGYNITMELLPSAGLGVGDGPGLGAGDGPGLGPGEGAGQGPGAGISPQIEQPLEIKEYQITEDKILRKIDVGSFINVPITISNFKDESLNLRFSVEGTARHVTRMDKERLIIEERGEGQVMVTLVANVGPGVYEGYFVITGDVNEKIPMYILVKEKDRLDVESLIVSVKPDAKRYKVGSNMKYRVDLKNLLTDQQYKISLTHTLVGMDNNHSLVLEQEDVAILTAFSLEKTFDLPEEFEAGTYQIFVKAEYLEISSDGTAIIKIVDPLYKYKVLGIVPLWMIVLVGGGVGGSIYLYFFLKKRRSQKRRYQIELDYNQLPKPGSRSAFVGMIAESDKRTYFDLDILQTHTLVAGSTGGGKSVAAQGIVEEALLKGTSVMVFDPTVQWTGFLRKGKDKHMFELYKKFGMKKSDAQSFNGNIKQIENAREIIDFKKFMKPGEINVFVANKLDTRDYEIFVSNTIREVFHENMPESRELRLMLVFDEFHRLLPKYGGTGQVLIQVERAAREFRKWGVGLVLISQVISDFQSEVLANINTQVQMRTKDEGDLKRAKEEYGENILKSLVKAAIGTGMVENAQNNHGKPYFIAFRPLLHSTQRLSDDDLANYNKYNEIVDDLEYQLEQLEKNGVDVFDLQLELKLAQDKVKQGSFNMVDIYLDGLNPRIKTQWEKIGKNPEKRKIRYISEEELKKELEKAKKVQDKKDGKDTPSLASPKPKAAEDTASEPTQKQASEEEAASEQSGNQESSSEQAAGEEDEGVVSAIAKAKQAQEASKSATTRGAAQEPKPAASPPPQASSPAATSQESVQSIAALQKEISQHLADASKQQLSSWYGNVQQRYQASSLEERKQLIPLVHQLQEQYKKAA